MNYINATFTTKAYAGLTTVSAFSGPCMLGNVVFTNQAGSAKILKIYDGLSALGTLIFDIEVADATTIAIPGDWRFTTGIWVVAPANTHTTIQYAARGALA